MTNPMPNEVRCRHNHTIPCPTCRMIIDNLRANNYRPTHEWEIKEYNENLFGIGEYPSPFAPRESATRPTGIVKSKVQLAKVGDRHVSMVGWSMATVADHLRTHDIEEAPEDKWCSVECMARTMFQRNTEENRQKVRERVRGLFRALLTQGYFMVIAYDESPGGRGKIVACRILSDTPTEQEVQAADRQLERMRSRKEVSEELFAQAHALIPKRLPANP